MSNVAQIVWKCVGITIAIGLLVAAVVAGYLMRPTSEPCSSFRYIIEDKTERMYLTENELNQLLNEADIYPLGRAIDRISLHRIEKTIRRHPMVRTAECYLTPRQEVRVSLTQRVPLLRVQTPLDAYFIDTDRRVMPMRESVKDSVLLVTGVVGQQMAADQLANFAFWLQHDAYWGKKIHHVHMRSPQMMVVYLAGADQPRVIMGQPWGYERKLKKLRIFFEKGAEATEDKHYTELDVRFHGQVIGRE